MSLPAGRVGHPDQRQTPFGIGGLSCHEDGHRLGSEGSHGATEGVQQQDQEDQFPDVASGTLQDLGRVSEIQTDCEASGVIEGMGCRG